MEPREGKLGKAVAIQLALARLPLSSKRKGIVAIDCARNKTPQAWASITEPQVDPFGLFLFAACFPDVPIDIRYIPLQRPCGLISIRVWSGRQPLPSATDRSGTNALAQ